MRARPDMLTIPGACEYHVWRMRAGAPAVPSEASRSISSLLCVMADERATAGKRQSYLLPDVASVKASSCDVAETSARQP
jgi:hypothetical protein